ncbi:Ger(x)C family spore germination protein [Clostridium oryzae]|uniref:Spore germination protein A3 n=1 Tax=Clostridium oryzae TaxID=1450648 RepID=A0A1V4ITQ8_9CLOT|nr:Ger(x)C family spore germination protein [Clostridium oryzae]OPJ63402.1 spore germination protein A3 precursor [Clostridium oryzae]
MKKTVTVILIISMMFTTGCWDKVEIDRKVFVSTIGIDPGKDIKNYKLINDIKPDEPFGERDIQRMHVTYAFPDISAYSSMQPQIPSDKFIETDAYSLEDARSNASAKTSRQLDLSHVKMIAISSEVFNYKDIMKEIVDYLARDPVIDRKLYVILVQGDVREFLNAKTQTENTVSAYIQGLMESGKTNTSVLPMTLNEFIILLEQNGNAIVPAMKLDKEKNELEVTGIALIKNYGLVSFLTARQTSTVEMLRGKFISGKRVIYNSGVPIDFLIDGIKRRINVNEKGGKLVYTIDINMEGRVVNYTVDRRLYKDSTINFIEKSFNESQGEECRMMARMLQEEYGSDILGLREYVKKYKPNLWERIKGDWEEQYKSAEIVVNVNTEVRRVGVRK